MHGAAHEVRALSRELPFTAVERRLTPTLTAEPAQILPPTSLSLILVGSRFPQRVEYDRGSLVVKVLRHQTDRPPSYGGR